MVAFVAPDYQPDLDDLLTSGVLSRRVVAWLLDAVLVGLLIGAFLFMATIFTVLTLGLGSGIYFLLPAIPFAYYWISIASTLSATPGQAMTGLAIVDNETLRRPNAAQALIWIVGYLLTISLLFLLLGIAIFSTRHRTLHDILANLVVVRRKAVREPGFGG